MVIATLLGKRPPESMTYKRRRLVPRTENTEMVSLPALTAYSSRWGRSSVNGPCDESESVGAPGSVPPRPSVG
jgi:hypothetical protein